ARFIGGLSDQARQDRDAVCGEEFLRLVLHQVHEYILVIGGHRRTSREAHLSPVTQVTAGQGTPRGLPHGRSGEATSATAQPVTVIIENAVTPLTVTDTTAVPGRRPVSSPVAGFTAITASSGASSM